MEAKREAKDREFGDENIQKVLFTAGTAVLMACLKRFIMMFFIEQWRLWVFLLLNVVLLAIFFTSMPTKTSTQSQESDQEDNVKIVKRKKPQCRGATESHEHENVKEEVEKEVEKCVENVKQETIEDGKNEGENENEDEEEESSRLSKEELNARVEAFITTFRRHLVSDAIRGRDHYYFSKKKREINGGFACRVREKRSSSRTGMNLSTQGGKSFVL